MFGQTKDAATKRLKEALRDRQTPTGGDLTAQSTVENWIAK